MADKAQTMLAKDVIRAVEARAYMTINGKRRLLLNAKKVTVKVDKTKEEVAILGRINKGNKSTGAKGTGSMTVYDNTPIFTELMLDFMNHGKDVYFDLQVTNEDSDSAAGSRTVVIKGVNIDNFDLTLCDADGKYLEQDVDFTFEGLEIPENFKELDGMQA